MITGRLAILWILLFPQQGGPDPGALQDRILRARDRVLPALVHVEPILELYRGGRRSKMAVTGSGVVVSADGVVVTANHVVEGAKRVTCVLANQDEVPAEVVGRDALTDVAVLRLDLSRTAARPRPVDLGRSSELREGQFVLALGSPLGLARSLSLGVVSSPNRYLPEEHLPGERVSGSLNNWIQTDAAINPGNSGGPLVDLEGRVVGINARAIHVFGENLGFAIPVDTVREILPALLEEGEVTRSWFGLRWQPLKALGHRVGLEALSGVVVGGVFPGSPAERAGIRAGDTVLALDGRPVRVRYEEELPAFRKRIAELPQGRVVELRVMRDGEERTVGLRTERMPRSESEEVESEVWGFTARGVGRATARRLRLEGRRGVLVTGVKPDGPADEAGLRTDDVVRLIGEEGVRDLEGFRRLHDRLLAEGPGRVYLEVGRGRTTRFLILKPDYGD